MNETENYDFEANKRENELICDVLETVGVKDAIVITEHSLIYGVRERVNKLALLSNAIVFDSEFCELVTKALTGAIGYLSQELQLKRNTQQND
jgi:hypothetical protein